MRKPATRRRATALRSDRAVAVLLATRKGAWIFRSADSRKSWRCSGPHFLGNIVHHLVADPRTRGALLAAVSTGHLGPSIFRSSNFGRTWTEASRPPAFDKAAPGEHGRAVNHTFWLTPGHGTEPGVWYAGTSPHGLFRSEDSGDTWNSCRGLNDDPQYREWMGGPQDGTPDGPSCTRSLSIHAIRSICT